VGIRCLLGRPVEQFANSNLLNIFCSILTNLGLLVSAETSIFSNITTTPSLTLILTFFLYTLFDFCL
jgi:hypothetical protein